MVGRVEGWGKGARVWAAERYRIWSSSWFECQFVFTLRLVFPRRASASRDRTARCAPLYSACVVDNESLVDLMTFPKSTALPFLTLSSRKVVLVLSVE
jgi:hypothetical protein